MFRALPGIVNPPSYTLDITGKDIEPTALLAELVAAGVPATSIGISGTLMTIRDAGGSTLASTPTILEVVQDHVPPDTSVDAVAEGLDVIGDMISGIDFGGNTGSEELAGIILAQNELIKLIRSGG